MRNASSEQKIYKVLFVDDHKPFLEMYSLKFSQSGFETAVCQDSSKVLELARQTRPDIIFLDLVMGKHDGIEVLKQLKSTLETKWIPVVMFSNIDNAADRDLCIKNGASYYLVKIRFTPTELAEYARKVLTLM